MENEKDTDIREAWRCFAMPKLEKPNLQYAHCRNCDEYFHVKVWTDSVMNHAVEYDYCSKCKLEPIDKKSR